MFGSLGFHRSTGNIIEPNIVKSGFCSIQFTVAFAGTQNVDRQIRNIVELTIVKSWFHCRTATVQ